VAELIAGGRAFARFEGGDVVYKAEIGALSAKVGQIQGVWVHPDRRGHGLGASGTAAVADRLVRGLGRTASLRERLQHRGSGGVQTNRVRRGGRYATVLF